MKVKSDDRGRLASIEMFRPNSAFDVEPQPDGSTRVVELVPKEVSVVTPRRVGGRLRRAEVVLPRKLVAAAIRAEREVR